MATIMVVDDEPEIVLLIKSILEKEGYKVIEAYDGKECLEKLEKEKPDLILLDVMMFDMSGWEVCRKIKDNENTKHITVAMLTVKSTDEDKIHSLDRAVADWHIAKPIERDKFLKTVKWLLEAPMKRT